MSHLIQGFNILYGEFISKIENMLPDSSKISHYNNLRKIIQKTNNRLPMQMFMSECHPFSDKIFNCNDEFFINKMEDFDIDVINDNFSNKLGLSKYWNNLNSESKDAIWQYMKSLLLLGYTAYNIEWSKEIVETPFKDLAKLD